MISDKIRGAQCLAARAGLVLATLSLPREEYERLKHECLQFPVTLKMTSDLMNGLVVERLERRVFYEPFEKITYAGTTITPEDVGR